MKHFRQLWVQVLIAIVLAMVLGLVSPETAAAMKPLGDAFIALLRMMLAPIIFTTVVLGLAHVSDVGKLGRMGAKSLLYFEVVSTVGLLVGFVGAWFKAGLHMELGEAGLTLPGWTMAH